MRRALLLAAVPLALAACGPAVDIEGVLYDPAVAVPGRRDAGTTTSTVPRPDAGPRDVGPRDVGTPDAGDPNCPEPTLEAIDEVIFQRSCATEGCHVGPAPAEGLALDGTLAELGARLRQPAAQSPSHIPLVSGGQPGSSYLYLKVYLATPPAGERMPPGEALTACQLSAIRRWIEAGAP